MELDDCLNLPSTLDFNGEIGFMKHEYSKMSIVSASGMCWKLTLVRHVLDTLESCQILKTIKLHIKAVSALNKDSWTPRNHLSLKQT